MISLLSAFLSLIFIFIFYLHFYLLSLFYVHVSNKAIGIFSKLNLFTECYLRKKIFIVRTVRLHADVTVRLKYIGLSMFPCQQGWSNNLPCRKESKKVIAYFARKDCAIDERPHDEVVSGSEKSNDPTNISL